MEGAHDLGRTPSLVDTQVGHKVGSLEAAVAPKWLIPSAGRGNGGTPRQEMLRHWRTRVD